MRGNGRRRLSTWTAAVEGVWWASSLDEALGDEIGNEEYRHARNHDPYGKIVEGFRWIRHRHIHEVVITGADGPKRDAFPPPGADVLFISPSNRWIESDKVLTVRDKSPHLRAAYDEHVAHQPLDHSLFQAAQWFDRIFSACDWPPLADPVDPTEL